MSASFPVKNINPDNKRFSIYILIGEQGQGYSFQERNESFGKGGLGIRHRCNTWIILYTGYDI